MCYGIGVCRRSELKKRGEKAKAEASVFAKLLAQRKKDSKAKKEKANEKRRLSSSKDAETKTA